MRERRTKEQFCEYSLKHISLRNTLKDFYNDVYLPTLKEFDGKVYNIRFIKKLREKAEKISDSMFIRERDYDHIEVKLQSSKFSYSDYESMYYPCVLDNDGRLNYQKTIDSEMGKAWVKNHDAYTNEMQDGVDNYDKYIEVANELQKIVDKWNKLPHNFRDNFEKPYIYAAY